MSLKYEPSSEPGGVLLGGAHGRHLRLRDAPATPPSGLLLLYYSRA